MYGDAYALNTYAIGDDFYTATGTSVTVYDTILTSDQVSTYVLVEAPAQIVVSVT